MNNPMHAVCYDLAIWYMKRVRCKTAMDIGANIGGITNIMLEHGLGPVHCFEPVPDVFEKLQARYQNDSKVICNKLGLSDRPGMRTGVTVLVAWTIERPSRTGMSVCPDYVGKPTFDMRLETIDGYCKAHCPEIGFIKLDVDGYEPQVLRGGRQLLREQLPPIICELSGYPRKLGELIEPFTEHIFGLGYEIFSMDGRKCFDRPEDVLTNYPWDTSFDVMLTPRRDREIILNQFK